MLLQGTIHLFFDMIRKKQRNDMIATVDGKTNKITFLDDYTQIPVSSSFAKHFPLQHYFILATFQPHLKTQLINVQCLTLYHSSERFSVILKSSRYGMEHSTVNYVFKHSIEDGCVNYPCTTVWHTVLSATAHHLNYCNVV